MGFRLFIGFISAALMSVHTLKAHYSDKNMLNGFVTKVELY